MLPPGDSDEAEVFDFLDEWTRDVESGRELPLAHYLKRFPGHEEAIAREFVSRTSATRTAASSAAPSNLETSARLIGPYRLLRELGRGGQGTVWLAEDSRIARRVALKFLPSSFALLSADRRRRLQREAEVVSRLDHASICPVYEAQIDGETPYIAMRFVEGETLAAAIERAKSQTSTSSGSLALPPRNAIDVRRILVFFEKVARALHVAHEAGVIHRDFKPGNTMIGRDGEPVVLDFGQARDEHAELGEQTLSGEVLGTPAYMSPEQVAGHAHAIDRRTDVWSLGASLYEALTLERPFSGASVAQLLLAIQTDAPRNAREINPALGRDLAVVLETALEKDSQRRYATALDFAEDLRRVREHEPIRARPAGPLLRLQRWTVRHPALATSLGGLFLSLSIGLAWSLYLLGREHAALQRERTALEGEKVARGNTQVALGRERVALAEAQSALTHALGRHLAERSSDLLDEDSSASLALGIQAVEKAPNYQTRAALLSALDACRLATLFDGDPARLFLDLDVGANSLVAAAGLDDGTARIFAIDTGRELLRVQTHGCEVTHVRLDPMCEWLVTTTADEFVRVWNAESGELVRALQAPGVDAQWLEFDARGERLLALDRNGCCTIWRTSDWSAVADLRGAPNRFGSARFSPDGQLVLMSSMATLRTDFPRSNVACVWDANTARIVGELRGHTDWLASSEFGSSGRTIATSSADGTARLWRVPSFEPIGEPFAHDAPLTCARLSPGEHELVTGTNASDHSAAYLWRLETRERTTLRGAHQSRIAAVEFSPDGERIVSVSSEMVLQVWNAANGRELMRSSAWIPPLKASWTRDGRRIVMLGNANTASVWYGENPPDVYALVGHDAPVHHARFSPDGKLAVTAGEDGTARIWSTPNWNEPRGDVAAGTQLVVLRAAGMHITDALFVLDSRYVITLSREGVIAQWSARDGELVHEDRIDGAALSIDVCRGADIGMGETWSFAVVSSSGRVYVKTHACFVEPPFVLDEAGTSAHFSPDGLRLVVGRRDNSVRVYEFERRELVGEHGWTPTPRDKCGVVDLAVRPDGKQIAAACSDGRIRFFDTLGDGAARKHEIAFELQGIAYSPDGQRLVATGPHGRGAIRLQNLETNQRPRPFEVLHGGDFTCARFNRDGSLLLTASVDGTVFVRRTDDGVPFTHLVGHGGAIVDARFSEDDGPTRVITASADGTARIWPVDPLEPAKARKPRDLYGWERAREERLALPLEYR